MCSSDPLTLTPQSQCGGGSNEQLAVVESYHTAHRDAGGRVLMADERHTLQDIIGAMAARRNESRVSMSKAHRRACETVVEVRRARQHQVDIDNAELEAAVHDA